MNKHFKTYAPILISITLAGCSSAQKKQCENQNWFDYGHARAMSGQRLENDGYPKSCEAMEIMPNYSEIQKGYKEGNKAFCSEGIFLKAGKAGELIPSTQTCTTGEIPKLTKAYQNGVKQHCTKQGAFQRGLANKPNHQICPEKLRLSYQQNYQMGISHNIKKEIIAKEARILRIDQRLLEISQEMPRWKVGKARADDLRKKKDPTTAETLELLNKENYDAKIQHAERDLVDLPKEKFQLNNDILVLRQKLLESDSLVAPVSPGALDSE